MTTRSTSPGIRVYFSSSRRHDGLKYEIRLKMNRSNPASQRCKQRDTFIQKENMNCTISDDGSQLRRDAEVTGMRQVIVIYTGRADCVENEIHVTKKKKKT